MSRSPSWLKNGELNGSLLKEEIGNYSKLLQNSDHKIKKEGADKLHGLIVRIWSLDTRNARDAADIMCEHVRSIGGLEAMLQTCQSSTESTNETKELQIAVLRVLEQIMVNENRLYISQHKLFPFLLVLSASTETLEHVKMGTGVLENLFKVSSTLSLKLINSTGLDIVLYGCRYTDNIVLQHCAAAMANCALYGCRDVHKAMVAKHADQWLFPLAFSSDSAVKYYALIAICILASQPELAPLVTRSGALELVIPFLQSQDPFQFPKTCPNHAHGRTADWLKRLIPLIQCHSEEAQSLAAFHFAMEAYIKKEQMRLKVFDDINVQPVLSTAAREGSELTSRFATQALKIIGYTIPNYRYWNVLKWSPDQVSFWIQDSGLSDIADNFKSNLVTGEILLDISREELGTVGCDRPLVQKWLLNRINELKCRADFSTRDPEHICQWLVSVGPELALYKPLFMRNGITRKLLQHLNADTLQELGVVNPVHRLKILTAIDELVLSTGHDSPDLDTNLRSVHPALRRKYDVFLSYRRSSGSQLASLLKVHLQLRGLNVFLDVTGLGAGKFDDALLTTISNSSNMVTVLTPNSLDRCIGDVTGQDWVHKELSHAIETGIHIVPVMDNFMWPDSDTLPPAIKNVSTMNGVKWSHEYQEACVDKIVSFLHLPLALRRRNTRHDSMATFNTTTNTINQ